MGVAMTDEPSARAATIYDVARLAGVSHQTVSRFLTGTGGIRPANRVRVEDALRTLNYRTNNTARSLATRRTHRLGALVYELSGTGPGKTMQGASDAARRAGYSLDIVSLDPLNDVELTEALEVLNNRDLEGILATAPTDAIDAALRDLNVSVPIFVDRGAEVRTGEALPTTGPYAAMAHLIELGHRRIAHLAGPDRWTSARIRAEAYRGSTAAAGLAQLPIVAGDWSARSGYAAAAQLFAEPGVTAVFAANDRMALGLMLWLHDNGRRIPEDVSVVGFDDVAEAEFFHPPLTTIRQDFDAMGRAAAETLIAMIEHPGTETDVGYPVPELIVRASTGAPRG
jgi:DNA-binding LacI/PurR family transcriptional regulator